MVVTGMAMAFVAAVYYSAGRTFNMKHYGKHPLTTMIKAPRGIERSLSPAYGKMPERCGATRGIRPTPTSSPALTSRRLLWPTRAWILGGARSSQPRQRREVNYKNGELVDIPYCAAIGNNYSAIREYIMGGR